MMRARMIGIAMGSVLAVVALAGAVLPMAAKAAEQKRPEAEEATTVTARFTVQRVTLLNFSVYVDGKYENKICRNIEMSPVTSGDYFTATPSGKLEMIVANEAAAEAFEIGAVYELTFQKVSDGTPIILQKPPQIAS